MEEVKLIEFKETDLKEGIIIAGFPSIGLVSTISANYLIDSLGLKQIGAMDSNSFPALSVVHSAEPLSPVRIYAGVPDKGKKIAIFVSEFRPKPNLISPIADAIIEWAERKGCNLLISPEGMVVEGKEMEVVKREKAYAIGSTEEARNMLIQRGIPQFNSGIIAGVSGVLLNKGKYKGFNVISILAEAHPNYPDARAAASIIEVIASLLDIEINVAPLYEEAERIEKHLQRLHKQARPVVTQEHGIGPMYG